MFVDSVRLHNATHLVDSVLHCAHALSTFGFGEDFAGITLEVPHFAEELWAATGALGAG